jgi:cbb3-type cytochrome oxidase subunit 1
VWIVFAVEFFWPLARRAEKHCTSYVALWFYIATIITVAVLHVVNSLAGTAVDGAATVVVERRREVEPR